MLWSSKAEVRTVQDERLLATAARLGQHPYYRERLAELGLSPGDLRTISDLDRLPLTSKDDLVADPDRFRLEADPNTPSDYVLWDVAYTAGTSSGQPTPIYQTSYDFRAILFAQARMAEIRGMTSADRIANLFPLAPHPHGGWIRPTQAAAVIGASVVVGMGGQTEQAFPVTRRLDEIVELLVRTDVTVMWGVPSYLLRVLERVAEQGHRLPSLRLLACSGEPCRPGIRQAMTDRAEGFSDQPVAVSDSLGATELQFSLVECPGGGGFHNPAPEQAHIGVVDDDGRALPSGAVGRLVYTHLDRRGTLLLRYLIGDRAIFDDAPCPHCGWLGGRVVEHLGRESSYVKVRGNIISLESLFAVLDGLADVGDFRTVLHKPGDDPLAMDALTIEVVPATPAQGKDLGSPISRAVRESIGLSAEVVIVTQDQLWSPESGMKPVRFVDRRPVQ